MRILVTGGAGFIGSHLVERLLVEGHEARVLDNFSSGRRENLAFAKAGAALEVIEGDVRDASCLETAVAGVDGIFHEAALVSVPRSVDDPALSCDINALGTVRLFDAARRARVHRIVLASSAAVYGDTTTLPVTETTPARPLSPYGLDKLYTEQLAALHHALYGLQAVPLRYFNVFGPRQDPSSAYSGVISIFVSRLLAGQPITIHGDGEQTRDFVYVGDVVQANMRAMFRAYAGPAPLNVASGARISLNTLAVMLGEIVGAAPRITRGPGRVGDIRHSGGDIGAIRAALGYEPEWTTRAGLEALVAGIRGGAAPPTA